jgi:phosphatidylinositol-3-phosphatase
MLDKKTASLGILIVFALATMGLAAANGAIMSTSSSQGINHVILIMEENKKYSDIIGSSSAPYINQLANTYALATDWLPGQSNQDPCGCSLPQYMDISSGSDGGITNDYSSTSGHQTSQSNIFDLLTAHGYSWKQYAESMPSSCARSDAGSASSDNLYMVHHTMPPWYSDLNSVCAQYDVSLGSVSSQSGNFYTDLNSNNLPNLVIITPNACDDMHSLCAGQSITIASGDAWLKSFLPAIINSPEFSSTIVVITWDNGTPLSTPVATIVVGPPTLINYGHSSQALSHYSFLATVEQLFNLGNLGRNDATASLMTSIVKMNGVSTSTSSTLSSSSSTSSTTTSSSSSSTTTTASSSSSSTTISSSSTTTSSSSSSSSTSSSTQSPVSSSTSSQVSSSSTLSSVAPSSPNSGAPSQSNPIVGMLAVLSPAKNPPVAYGLASYEICLLGALGYVLIGARRVKEDGWRW